MKNTPTAQTTRVVISDFRFKIIGADRSQDKVTIRVSVNSNQIRSIFIYTTLFIQKKVPQSASQK